MKKIMGVEPKNTGENDLRVGDKVLVAKNEVSWDVQVHELACIDYSLGKPYLVWDSPDKVSATAYKLVKKVV